MFLFRLRSVTGISVLYQRFIDNFKRIKMIWNVGSRENQVIKGLLGRRKAVVSDLSFNMNLNANAINGVSSKHLP